MTPLAVHLNGTLITTSAPVAPGEIVVLYSVGLGLTNPATTSGKLVTSIANIVATPMQVLLSGTPLPAANVLYAGLAPGFAGLYQLNLRMPDTLPSNPEIRIAVAGQTSQPLVMLPTSTPPAPAPPSNPPANSKPYPMSVRSPTIEGSCGLSVRCSASLRR
jgi:uncharacterized protein (TIGR03437 family)